MSFRRNLNIFFICLIILATFYLIFSKKSFILTKIVNIEEKREIIEQNENNILLKNKYINIVNPKLKGHEYLKGFLQTPGGNVTIYLHYVGEHYTDHVLRGITWQSDLVQEMNNCIKDHPGVQVLDLGCNLGTFALNAASLGCYVVAVDASPGNAGRLAQSLLTNRFPGLVLNNAMNNERGRLVEYRTKGNFLAFRITQDNNMNGIEAIFIDDLVPFFDKDREIIIKIDIETKEIDALKKASTFFEQRNVIFVIMEWEHIKKMGEINYVINFFRERNFKSYASYRDVVSLSFTEYMGWPNDIFWKKDGLIIK